jgi:hypothetical protein
MRPLIKPETVRMETRPDEGLRKMQARKASNRWTYSWCFPQPSNARRHLQFRTFLAQLCSVRALTLRLCTMRSNTGVSVA